MEKLKVSRRGQQMSASPIRKLVPLAENAKLRGIEVLHLNIGQPDIETPPAAIQAVKDFTGAVVEYSHSAGNDSYRKKLSTYYQQHGIDVTSNEIIVTTGGSEAILFALLACCDEGDEIIVPEPFYANYNSLAVEAGVKVIPVASSIETGFALPAITAIEACITSKTKAIFICSPNNPTGYIYTMEEMKALGEIVQKNNLFLISDEAYREFCYEGKHTSALHLKGIDDHIILIDTISKRYSACGARVGTLVTKNKTVYNTVMKFAQARLSPPTFGQILGEAALDLPEDYFNITKETYQRRRDILVDRLNAMKGVVCPKPRGAFYAMAKLPVQDAELFCQWLLNDFSYNNQTVMLAPAPGFYATEGLGKNEVRLAYVINEKNIHAAMDVLEQALLVYDK